MKEINIQIGLAEILNEIGDTAYLTGKKSSQTENGNGSETQRVNDPVQSRKIRRALTYAFADVRKLCSRYLADGKHSDNNATDIPQEGVWKLTLHMPDGWDETVATSLTQNLHELLVNYALYKLFLLTAPDESEEKLMQAALCREEAKGVLEQRKTPVRRPCNYF